MKTLLHETEQLGFDKEYPFDTEVRDSFHERMCDEMFTGVDHDRNALEGPPQFAMAEYTSVEYEAIEYEDVRYETIDYEEFTRYVLRRSINRSGQCNVLSKVILC